MADTNPDDVLTAAEKEELRGMIMDLFQNMPHGETNFYRLMTNDACQARHLILEPERLRIGLPLDNGQAIGNSQLSSMGYLGRLPAELTGMVFAELDLDTLTKFRSVSKSARTTVDNLFQYRNIMNHAPQILRAVLALRTAKFFTLNDLDAALMSNTCKDCGEFGAYFHVPTCERVCYKCFALKEHRMPLNPNHVIYKFRFTKKEFKSAAQGIDWIRCIPGRYRLKGRVHFDRDWLSYLSYEQALQLKMRTSGLSREEVIRRADEYHTAKMLQYQNTVVRSLYRRAIPRPKFSPNPNPMAWPEEDRFQVVIGMPSISARSRDAIIEWGVSCNGCKKRNPTRLEKRSEAGRDVRYNQVKLYSKAGFIEHFLVCPHAREHFEEVYDLFPEDGQQYPLTPAQGCCIAGEGTTQPPGTGHSFWVPCRNFHYLHKVPAASV